jgi:hypothetical protein
MAAAVGRLGALRQDAGIGPDAVRRNIRRWRPRPQPPVNPVQNAAIISPANPCGWSGSSGSMIDHLKSLNAYRGNVISNLPPED